jgi:hypothetical protein
MAESSNGAVAQLGERLVCNQEATGSIPVSSTKNVAGRALHVMRSLWRRCRMELVDRILGLGPFLIPIVAIIVGGAIAIVAMVHSHNERIAKIERGIDPDTPRR